MDFQAAEDAYDAIRATSSDIAVIASATGFKTANIAKVKHHVFEAVHLLDRYADIGVPAEWRRFDADGRIADAWRRLAAGNWVAADIRLLKHEIAEAWYMRRHGPSYAAGHAAAQRRYPSPL